MTSFKKPKYFTEGFIHNDHLDTKEFEDKYFYHKDITNNEM